MHDIGTHEHHTSVHERTRAYTSKIIYVWAVFAFGLAILCGLVIFWDSNFWHRFFDLGDSSLVVLGVPGVLGVCFGYA